MKTTLATAFCTVLALAGCTLDLDQPSAKALLATADAPATEGTAFGQSVAYGKMARVCDAPRAPGTKVAQVGGFTLYDSNPASTALRAQYVTGFDDGCARQFSAALVLTGDVESHEMIRYLPGHPASFNATDRAYETIKARVCGVGQGTPCGRRIDMLARSTTFLTAYRSFGSSPDWVEILLHDGDLAAIDFKSK